MVEASGNQLYLFYLLSILTTNAKSSAATNIIKIAAIIADKEAATEKPKAVSTKASRAKAQKNYLWLTAYDSPGEH
ncbi:hypothetical protein [Lamprocystis purpurea]|jgi:hypothetical protein|uniref:hypothetical protein n=1 Tax=Lamprocystis purpurea TaxID=61598 RepID=UPI0012F73793|nr:hypothetical protein [Lamprocystis purpurea]MBV5346934.1 hypothetical protein [bacterium]